jgi:molybdenum cofactor cytidylyltransferase
MKLGGVLLAAGASSRFGGDKLLALVRDQPLALHALRGLAAGVDAGPLVIVARVGDDALKDALALPDHAVWVENADAARGMATSLQTGIAALAPDCDGAFVALADMPSVDSATYAALAKAFQRDDYAVVPVYRGRRGNPVLLGRALFGLVATLSGDVGAKPLLAAYADKVREVMVDDPGILADVDTPRDLASVLQPDIIGRQ